MTVYIDKEFRCHVSNDGTMEAVDAPCFDGKCRAYIEGYRMIPAGREWTAPDGTVYRGIMVAPWRDYDLLKAVQDAMDAGRK